MLYALLKKMLLFIFFKCVKKLVMSVPVSFPTILSYFDPRGRPTVAIHIDSGAWAISKMYFLITLLLRTMLIRVL
jgi:hypothetical protein